MENVKQLSHAMAHYLLAIHRLKEEKGYARVTDIASSLGLTKGSVSTAINSLEKKNLVVEENDSKFLLLTDLGHNEVHKILSSKTLLFYFLRDILGVAGDLALNDACVMEHLLHDETRNKFFEFMKKNAMTFKTALNLEKFASIEEFEASQPISHSQSQSSTEDSCDTNI